MRTFRATTVYKPNVVQILSFVTCFFKRQVCLLPDSIITYKTKLAYVCEICSKSFTQLRSLRRHQRSLHGETNSTCAVCNECFTRKDAVSRHEKKHEDVATHTCDTCSKQFYRKDMFSEHQRFCKANSRKRKVTDVDDNRTVRKQHLDNQIGEGETEEPLSDADIDPCVFSSAFNDSLKKLN